MDNGGGGDVVMLMTMSMLRLFALVLGGPYGGSGFYTGS